MRASTLFYLPDSIVAVAVADRFAGRSISRSAFSTAAPGCATRSCSGSTSAPLLDSTHRQPVERAAQARAARDRPADAAAAAARRRAVRRPRPAPEPRRRADAALLRVGGPDDVPVDSSDQGRGARLRSLRAAERRHDPRRRHARRARRRWPRRAARRPAISKRCSLRSREGTAETARRLLRLASPRFSSWLVAKECRELMASRAWWVLLLAMGPLVGVSFISAVRTYGEASGLNGTDRRRRRGVLAADRHLGADLQRLRGGRGLPAAVRRHPPGVRRSAERRAENRDAASDAGASRASPPRRSCCSAAGWSRRWRRSRRSLLWKSYGGSVYAPELVTVVARPRAQRRPDHRARVAAAAALTEHPSTAAILTLSVTVGTWILNFIAAVQGGIWERLAGYTPPAMVARVSARPDPARRRR